MATQGSRSCWSSGVDPQGKTYKLLIYHVQVNALMGRRKRVPVLIRIGSDDVSEVAMVHNDDPVWSHLNWRPEGPLKRIMHCGIQFSFQKKALRKSLFEGLGKD